MRTPWIVAGAVAALLNGGAVASAGPWEDGMVAYNKGDYVPAMKVFRQLAQAGNAKALNVIGVMHRNGEGVPASSRRAFMWFTIAARKGDANAKASLQDMSKDMRHSDMMDAELKSVVCEESDYRDCQY